MEEEWAVMRAENAALPQITPRRKRGAALLDPVVLGSCKRRQAYEIDTDSDEVSMLCLFCSYWFPLCSAVLS